ncbi:MAG: glycosyltransferase family 2 protein [Lachnospiraceae bacterium]
MTKISILIPAYNVEKYIGECIESVLQQDFKDFEIICVDDASTDNTLSILEQYASLDARIRIYRHEVNKGQSAARNLGFSYATGEYVYMLDADDKICDGALCSLYEICKKDKLDVVGFETFQFMDDESLTDKLPAKMIQYRDTEVLNGREALIYCMENEVFSLSVPTFMMRREYLKEIKLCFVEGILHEDVGYLFELITRAKRIRFLHEIYFKRRVRANSTMTKGFTDKNIEGYIKSFLKSFEIERDLPEQYKKDENIRFYKAVRKWQRDIYGRICQLYCISEKDIYDKPGGNIDESVRQLFHVIKLNNIGISQTEDILEDAIDDFHHVLEVYVCGTGQYTRRTIDVMAALDIVVKGVLVKEKRKNSFMGFPVYEISSVEDKNTTVVLSVSHYYADEYMSELKHCGLHNTLKIKF